MTVPESTSSARPGTNLDMARRMDRMEAAHEILAREVSGLTTTIGRVELNQQHAEELNKLRFDAGSEAQKQLSTKLDVFIDRIEKIINGEVDTAQARQGQQMVADYLQWRKDVDADRDEAANVHTQLKLLGRIGIIIMSGSTITTLAALFTLLSGK